MWWRGTIGRIGLGLLAAIAVLVALRVANAFHFIDLDAITQASLVIVPYLWLVLMVAAVVAFAVIAYYIVVAGLRAYWIPWFGKTLQKIEDLERVHNEPGKFVSPGPPIRDIDSEQEVLLWRFLFPNFAVVGGGLLLILLPLVYLGYRGYSSSFVHPDTMVTQTIRPLPSGEPFDATLTFASSRDEQDSSEVTLTMQSAILPRGSAQGFRLRSPRGKYRASLVGTNLDISPVTSDAVDTRYTGEMRWRWTIAARHDGKDSDHLRYGAQDVESLITWVINGKTMASYLGPRAEFVLHHRLPDEVLFTTVAPVLSFVLGIVTVVVGLFKSRSPKGEALQIIDPYSIPK